MNIKFLSPREFKPGIVVSLLERSYSEIISTNHKYWNQEKEKWEDFDKEIYQYPNSVGACVFITLADKQLVGFGSYDNRPVPEFGIIGHNCVLPEFRGRGIGKQQILEILDRFRSMHIKKAKVSTCSHSFFIPAQRMYISCGFIEINRKPWDMDSSQDIIEYEKRIG
jgi:GNAT superfamily N-acetyltransferase